jgi:uncharacterized protein
MVDAGIPPLQPYPSVPHGVSSEERNLAMLAHVLQIFTGFIGPLIIFLVKRESKFVRYHSLMALFWQLIVMAFWIILLVLFFTLIVSAGLASPAGPSTPVGMPEVMVLIGLLVWAGGMLLGVGTLVLGIVYAIKAYDGKWNGYPIIKRWAAKAAGL